ncbi:MAG: 50S ribosomal protein L35 [Patescibacteria group bacterium]|mgnify:CR=1 FL=1
MRKTVSKRIRVTRTGKVLRRAMGLCHFRAKKSSSQIKRKKITRSIDDLSKKLIKKYL